MLARMWHGRVPREKAERYHQYLLNTGLNDYANTKGNEGVFLLRRDEGDVTHYTTFTLWDSLDDIKRFAGEDYEKARYYPDDENFLLEKEPYVVHFEVMEPPSFLKAKSLQRP